MTTDETYNGLMQQVKDRKKEIGLSNNELAKAAGDSRVNIIQKLKRGNVHLKTFIALCHALKLQIILVKINNIN